MFQNIPLNRLVIYLLAAGLLPVVFVMVHFFTNKNEIEELSDHLAMVQERIYTLKQKQALNTSARHEFCDVDHFYIDKQLENLTFREDEIASLKKLSSNPNFPDDDQVKKRLEFLSGKGNKLLFAEGVVQTSPSFQEVVESQVHPVEVDVKDMQQILARIEGIDIGECQPGANRPQLIITDFKLEKKSGSANDEVFILNMKLLRREFL